MNTRPVDPRTIWALLAMEVGLALPIISLPTQGDRLPGPMGPLLLALLLPLGYVAVYQIRDLRDPSWRLLCGIGLALATRGVVSVVPESGLTGLALWMGRSVVPMAIGIALWWRGSALSVADLTAADVRTEFGVLGLAMLVTLSVTRPFVLPDPVMLAGSVGLFAVGGLVATALARQDAAQVAPLRFGRVLASVSAVLPVLAGGLLVSVLRPALLGTMWSSLGRLVELILWPIGWLLAWLASLFPRGSVQPQIPPAMPPQPALPDPAVLEQLRDRQEWLGWLLFAALLLLASVVAMLVVRVMLANWIGAPLEVSGRPPQDLIAERSGTPGDDAHDFFGWLVRWLRTHFGFRTARADRSAPGAGGPAALDAWAAYRSLLEWASAQGLGRGPAETTGQLRDRLVRHSPESTEAIDMLTSTYEWDRYGAIAPPVDRLRRVRTALRSLIERP